MAWAQLKKVEGFSEAPLTPRQLTLMSPWMLASRATPEAFQKIPVQTYLDRWFSLLNTDKLTATLDQLTGEDLARRDRQHRAALFNPLVDPVWPQIEQMIGADVGEELRQVLKIQDPQ